MENSEKLCYIQYQNHGEFLVQELDYKNWKRREVYEYFSKISNPFYMTTFKQDVTNLYDYAKSHNLSFYNSMIWACSQAINLTDAFLITMRNGKFFILNQRNPSFTNLKSGDENFFIVTLNHNQNIKEFCKEASELSKNQQNFINEQKESDALIYFSCLPWIELTALTNARDLSCENSLNDNIPRISWGKFIEENGKKKLGISLEVNHRFIDGFHIGQFALNLEKIITNLPSENHNLIMENSEN